MTDVIIQYNELHQNYLWGKELQIQAPNHWKYKLMNINNYEKAINLVNFYIDLMKVHENHLKHLDNFCLIITNILSCSKYNKDEPDKKFYCFFYVKEDHAESWSCLNLESNKILCREHFINGNSYSEIETDDILNHYDLDYPQDINKLFN